MPEATLRHQLFNEILHARQRIYQAGRPTPLESLRVPGALEVLVKREDLSPIHAYKWRGAYNFIACLTPEERAQGVVTASAGNHAQGVALAAAKLDCRALIFMPVSTPRLKRESVQRLGGDGVEVRLHGDTYHEAFAAAQAWGHTHGMVYAHAFDDLRVMGGQGTLADEVLMAGSGPFDRAYLQVGGGGMAAAVACWLKYHQPGIRIIGVEGVDQACMQAALQAGQPVLLDKLDVFCDGTAVSQAGAVTFPLCRELIDEWRLVTNDEVCTAMQHLWSERRVIPEPAGAMGLAGLLQDAATGVLADQRSLVVLCGANMDFRQLALIARNRAQTGTRRRSLRLEISEREGSMLTLLESCFGPVNLVDFQYGKTHPDQAWPVISVEDTPEALDALLLRLRTHGVPVEDVTGTTTLDFRAIPLRGDLIQHPLFVRLEFHERAGALREFLAKTRASHASLCYFNYANTGERVGRALIGFEFPTPADRESFRTALGHHGQGYRQLDELPPEATTRLLPH